MHQRVPSGSIRLTLSPVPPGGTPRRAPSPSIRVHVERRTSHALLSLPSSWVKTRLSRNGLRRPFFLLVVGGTVLALFILVLRPPRNHAGPSTSGDTPAVPRGVLEKLRLLELHFGADEDAHDYRRQRQADSDAENARDPPAVAAIPEFRRPDPLAPAPKPRMRAETLDATVCDGPCSFLVPAWLGEQETKAQQHLYQLGLLAMALNRTLVLPNVQKSRMATCQSLPFSFYYADDALANFGIPTISQAGFLEWAERRDPAPSAQVVSIVNAHASHLEGALEVDTSSDATLVPGKPKRKLCLNPPKGRCQFAKHSPLSVYPPAGYHKSEATRTLFGESLVKTLQSTDVINRSSRVSDREHDASSPDVLALNYELRFPIFTPQSLSSISEDLVVLPFEHFEYASIWTDLADSISRSLGKFAAVHWRTESLAPTQMKPCAQALINRLVKLHRDHPDIETVFLATDYPLEDSDRPHSGTFRQISPEHHSAFRTFLKQFGKELPSMRLTTLANEAKSLVLPPKISSALSEFVVPVEPQQQEREEGDASSSSSRHRVALDLAEFDTGLLGIIDKSICMTAPVFLSGYTGEGGVGSCAKVSSFTKQIVDRRHAFDSDAAEGIGGEIDRGLLNIVGHFSQNNKWDD